MEILREDLEARNEVDIFPLSKDTLCLIKWGHTINMNYACGNCSKATEAWALF